MICPNCSSENPESSRFCGHCATPLPYSLEIFETLTRTMEFPPDELAVGELFAGRYRVIEELGRGGMGHVYKVYDTKLKETLALKVIRPEIAAQRKTIERFENELKIARRISQRNVCRMYEMMETGGKPYITMEYVAGEDLKSIIRMMGQMSAGQAIAIARQVCEGMVEAHRLGIVHRDLKPHNIMIDREGKAKIMDFGIALSLQEEGLTGSGVMVGTPDYMSPEQVETKTIDQRSDIYSLGLILFEMVTGRLPFHGETPLAVAIKHRLEKPQDPRELNAQLPEELSRVILKCLEKEPGNRYQTAEELISDLNKIAEEISTTEAVVSKRKPTTVKDIKVTFRKRWMALATIFMAILTLGVGLLYISKEGPAVPSVNHMLVVLPFENLGAPEDEYFTDGITEEMTSRLSGLHGLGVISRSSAMKYKKTMKTMKEIGEELGVDYVLEGTVRWNRSQSGNGRVRVTPQLIRVADDTQLWSEQFDRELADIFSVQSEIAEQVASRLDITLLAPERRVLNAKPTQNLRAYDCYLKGFQYEEEGWSYSSSIDFENALEMYEKAIELDPQFALAYANISNLYTRMYFFGTDRSAECMSKAWSAVSKALELEPDNPTVQLALATYYYRCLLDYDRALELFRSVQKSYPNISPDFQGYIQRRQGKWEECLVTLEKAFKLDPRYSQLAYEIGGASLSMRDFEKAEEWFDRALSLSPERLTPRLGKIAIHILRDGNTKKARDMSQTLPSHPLADYMRITIAMLERNYSEVLDSLAFLSYDSFQEQHFFFHKDLLYASVYQAKKDVALMKAHAEKARLALEKAIQDFPDDPRFHAALGLAYAYLGLKAEAIHEGNQAVNIYSVAKDAALGPSYVLNLAKIYALVGEKEKAIGGLEYLLSIPAAEYLWQLVSIPLLRLDPQWDALRDQPKFERLIK